MADPQQQLNQINAELDRANEKIQDLSKILGDNLTNKFLASVASARKLTKSLNDTKSISKELNKIQEENEVRIIKRKIAEESYTKALTKQAALSNNASKKRKEDAEKEVKLAKEKFDKTRAELVINQQIEDSLRKTLDLSQNQKGILDIVGRKFKDIEESLSKQALQLFVFKAILDSALRFNKTSVEISKNLGYGAAQADRVTNNMVNAARGSENLNFTLANASEAMDQLVSSTGLVSEYSADTLETQIMLTKQFGLQADEAAGIYKFSVLNNKSASETNKAMVSAFVAARNQFKVGANFKQVMAEAAKVSGQLAANLGYNPDRITKAVVAMKAFGTTLEQTKAQGEALLNFESSLEAELKAELLTGQAINLERARAAALAGDQVKLAEELANQGMTLEKFQKMNVLAQKSYSEALGLSADQLSEQLQKQKLAIESGKSLAQLTEEEALEAQKRQNIQDQFNQAMLKLQDIIGGLVAGPLGMMLSVLSDALSLIGKIVSGIQSVLGSGLTKVLLGTITGLAVGGPVGALVGGIAGIASAAIADDMVGYGARTLVTPDGPIALNNNDTVIAGTNLFKGDDVMSFGKGALRLGGGNDELIAKLDQIASRPAVAYIQGERPFADTLGRQSQLFTSGMQNQSKLA
jgi:hypothetical protein